MKKTQYISMFENQELKNKKDKLIPDKIIKIYGDVELGDSDANKLIIQYKVPNGDIQIPLYICGPTPYGTVYGTDMFNKIEVDGIEVDVQELDNNRGLYTFKQKLLLLGNQGGSSDQIHVVKYTLKNPKTIGMTYKDSVFIRIDGENPDFSLIKINSMFVPQYDDPVGDLTYHPIASITFPNTVENIGVFFDAGSALESIIIPNGVKSIGSMVFNEWPALEKITSLSLVAPQIDTYVNNTRNWNTFPEAYDMQGVERTLYVPTGATGYDVWLEQLGEDWTLVEI